MNTTRLATGTVLVVDDDPSVVRCVREALEDDGYRVLTALGAPALRMAQERRPDVILLDLRMPQMDGAEISQRLRADPRTQPIPIIVLSAERDLAARAARLPVDAHLPKPFDLDALSQAVARWTTATDRADGGGAARAEEPRAAHTAHDHEYAYTTPALAAR